MDSHNSFGELGEREVGRETMVRVMFGYDFTTLLFTQCHTRVCGILEFKVSGISHPRFFGTKTVGSIKSLRLKC